MDRADAAAITRSGRSGHPRSKQLLVKATHTRHLPEDQQQFNRKMTASVVSDVTAAVGIMPRSNSEVSLAGTVAEGDSSIHHCLELGRLPQEAAKLDEEQRFKLVRCPPVAQMCTFAGVDVPAVVLLARTGGVRSSLCWLCVGVTDVSMTSCCHVSCCVRV